MSNANFGGTVSLSGDGNTLAVGSFGETGLSTGVFRGEYNPGVNFESFTFLPSVGAAYLFERSGDDWSQLAYIKASNTEPFDRFADSLDLSGDGNTLAISAGSEASAATGINGDQEDNSAPGAGAVYLY